MAATYTPNEIKTYCLRHGLDMHCKEDGISLYRDGKLLRAFMVIRQHIDGRDFDNWLKFMGLPPTGKRHD